MSGQFQATHRALYWQDRKQALIGGAVGCLLVAAWTWWFVAADIHSRLGSYEARLEATTVPFEVRAPVAEVIVEHRLTLGSAVKRGDILVRFDDRAKQAELRELAAQISGDRIKLQTLQEGSSFEEAAAQVQTRANRRAQAKAELAAQEAARATAYAREQLRRMAELAASGGAPTNEVRSSTREVETEQSRLFSSKIDGEMLKLQASRAQEASKARIRELAADQLELQARIDTAMVRSDRIRIELERYTIRSAIDGIVGEVHAPLPGVAAKQHEVLATVVAQDKLKVVAFFDPQRSVGKIRRGAAARMRLDAFPWTEHGFLEGYVEQTDHPHRAAKLRVEVSLLAGNPAILRQHGMTGQLEIDVEETTPARMVLRAIGQWIDSDNTLNSQTSEPAQP